MNYRISIPFLAGIIGLAACDGKYSERGVTITANVEGLQAGEPVYYAPEGAENSEQYITSEAGKFTMHVPIAAGQAEWYRVWIGSSPKPDNIIHLFLDSGHLRISGAAGGFKDVKYTGTQVAEEYNDFNKYRDAGLDGAKGWINSHPKSALATAIIEMLFQGGVLPQDTVISMLALRDPQSMDNLPAKRLEKWLAESDAIIPGKIAPDFTMADTSGRLMSLRDLRGKYVLLDFWASWCGPCRAENPNVLKAYQQFKEKGFTVLGISLDRQADSLKWIEAVRKDQLQWAQLSDLKGWDNAAAQLYKVKAIPASFLLDPEGKIIARDVRGEQLHKKLEEIFKTK